MLTPFGHKVLRGPRGSRRKIIRWVLLAVLAVLHPGCENVLYYRDLPVSDWHITSAIIDSLTATSQHRQVGLGNSSTLYLGTRPDESGYETVAFVQLPDIDSTRIADAISLQLQLFQRGFGQTLDLDPAASFALSRIESAAADTLWLETDTTVAEAVFTQAVQYETVGLSQDTVYFSSDSFRTDLIHLDFELPPTWFDQWRKGAMANNGVLISPAAGSDLYAFHSRSSFLRPRPRIALTYQDADSVAVSYISLLSDLTAIRGELPVPPADSTMTYLGLAGGYAVHFPLDSVLDKVVTVSVASAELVLFPAVSVLESMGTTMDIRILRLEEDRATGDSTSTYLTSKLISFEADSLRLPLTSLVKAIANGTKENYGIDLVVNPTFNDFDMLPIYNHHAQPGLQPRLELIYSQPYVTNDGANQ